ncbi:MAG TPA: hypothetical protein VF809_01680 [Candidatus Saccharimonadales bacterium]
MSPQKSPKKRFHLGGGNLAMTVAMFAGGALIFMIIVAILLNAFAPKKVSGDLTTMAQVQTELIRIADKGAKTGTQQVTKNLAITIQFSMNTQRKEMLAFMAKRGVTVNDKELVLKQKATTDQELASARTTSTFDSVFTGIMQDELTAYANDLKTIYSNATSKSEKELMSDYYEQTQLLISQIPYTQQKIDAAGQ